MANTMEATTTKQDIVSPTRGHYKVRYIWVLDEKTQRPVRVKAVYDFS